MKDAYTDWRTVADGNLTATETSPAIELGPAPMGGFPVQINIPEANADADTLNITFTQSATLTGVYATFHTLAEITGEDADDGIKRQFTIQNTLPFVKCVMTVAGSSPDFGDVSAGLDAGAGHTNVLTVGD